MVLKWKVLVNGPFPFYVLSKVKCWPYTPEDGDKMGQTGPRQVTMAKLPAHGHDFDSVMKDEWKKAGCRVEGEAISYQ